MLLKKALGNHTKADPLSLETAALRALDASCFQGDHTRYGSSYIAWTVEKPLHAAITLSDQIPPFSTSASVSTRIKMRSHSPVPRLKHITASSPGQTDMLSLTSSALSPLDRSFLPCRGSFVHGTSSHRMTLVANEFH